jgi:hypothetical protein
MSIRRKKRVKAEGLQKLKDFLEATELLLKTREGQKALAYIEHRDRAEHRKARLKKGLPQDEIVELLKDDLGRLSAAGLIVDFKIERIAHKGQWRKISSIRFSKDQQALLEILLAATKKLWQTQSPIISENLQSRIKAWVCRFKFGEVPKEKLFESVSNDLLFCLRQLKRRRAQYTPPEKAASLLTQESITKTELRKILASSNRTIERYCKHGLRGIRLKKRGRNGRFLTADIFEFIRSTGKYSELLQFSKTKSTKGKE